MKMILNLKAYYIKSWHLEIARELSHSALWGECQMSWMGVGSWWKEMLPVETALTATVFLHSEIHSNPKTLTAPHHQYPAYHVFLFLPRVTLHSGMTWFLLKLSGKSFSSFTKKSEWSNCSKFINSIFPRLKTTLTSQSFLHLWSGK